MSPFPGLGSWNIYRWAECQLSSLSDFWLWMGCSQRLQGPTALTPQHGELCLEAWAKMSPFHSLALPGSCTTATERQPQQASFLVEVFQGQYFARDIFYPWNKLNSVLLLMLACVFDSNWCNMLFFCVFPAWSVLGKEVGLVVTK